MLLLGITILNFSRMGWMIHPNIWNLIVIYNIQELQRRQLVIGETPKFRFKKHFCKTIESCKSLNHGYLRYSKKNRIALFHKYHGNGKSETGAYHTYHENIVSDAEAAVFIAKSTPQKIQVIDDGIVEYFGILHHLLQSLPVVFLIHLEKVAEEKEICFSF